MAVYRGKQPWRQSDCSWILCFAVENAPLSHLSQTSLTKVLGAET